jgi:hypothetical protein
LGARPPEVGAGEPFFSSGVLGTGSDSTAICSLHNEQPASEFLSRFATCQSKEQALWTTSRQGKKRRSRQP